MTDRTENAQRMIEVGEEQLPLHCPLPEHVSWNSHPRVFLPVEKTGEALCPYCGTRYRLRDGARAHAH